MLSTRFVAMSLLAGSAALYRFEPQAATEFARWADLSGLPPRPAPAPQCAPQPRPAPAAITTSKTTAPTTDTRPELAPALQVALALPPAPPPSRPGKHRAPAPIRFTHLGNDSLAMGEMPRPRWQRRRYVLRPTPGYRRFPVQVRPPAQTTAKAPLPVAARVPAPHTGQSDEHMPLPTTPQITGALHKKHRAARTIRTIRRAAAIARPTPATGGRSRRAKAIPATPPTSGPPRAQGAQRSQVAQRHMRPKYCFEDAFGYCYE